MSRTDDGSVCPKSMNGEHCQHFYYDWEPAPLEGHHEGHDGPHCCYCDRDRDRLLSENAVVQDRQRSRFIVSLDTDGLGARAVVMRKDPDGTVTGLACVGHETRDGGTIASEFDPWGEGEPPEVFFTYPLSDTTRGFDAAKGEK